MRQERRRLNFSILSQATCLWLAATIPATSTAIAPRPRASCSTRRLVDVMQEICIQSPSPFPSFPNQTKNVLGEVAAPIREVSVSPCRRYAAAGCGKNLLMLMEVADTVN